MKFKVGEKVIWGRYNGKIVEKNESDSLGNFYWIDIKNPTYPFRILVDNKEIKKIQNHPLTNIFK